MEWIRGCEVSQYIVALDFYEAYKRCCTSNNDNRIAMIPAFANGFFACELFLKILIDNKIKCHDLYKLYDKLSDEYKNKLESNYSSIQLDGLSFEEFIKKIRSGFEFWRYSYEDNNKDFEDNYPFEYSEKFLETYLPILKSMAENHGKAKDNIE